MTIRSVSSPIDCPVALSTTTDKKLAFDMYTARLIVTVLRRHLSLKQKRLRLCPDRCHERAGGMPSSRSHYRSWTIQTLRDRLVSFNAVQIDYKQNLTICFQQYRLVTNSSLLFKNFVTDLIQMVYYGLISHNGFQTVYKQFVTV